MIEIEQEIPNTEVAYLDGETIIAESVHNLLTQDRSMIIGLPGGFTPVCTQHHLPSIASRRRSLQKLGIDRFMIFVTDNPWTVAYWAGLFKFSSEFEWFSDGNGDFARQCGLMENGRSFFLGNCSRRYVIQTKGTRVDRLSVEGSVSDMTCTSGDEQVKLLNLSNK